MILTFAHGYASFCLLYHDVISLTGAPLQLRGYKQWPSDKFIEIRRSWLFWALSQPLTLRRLPSQIGFDLGESGRLNILCDPVGVTGLNIPNDQDERIDLRLTTRLAGFPVSGPMWGWLGCGGRWWFEQFRLPAVRQLLKAYHEMVHEQMMLYYIAALKS